MCWLFSTVCLGVSLQLDEPKRWREREEERRVCLSSSDPLGHFVGKKSVRKSYCGHSFSDILRIRIPLRFFPPVVARQSRRVNVNFTSTYLFNFNAQEKHSQERELGKRRDLSSSFWPNTKEGCEISKLALFLFVGIRLSNKREDEMFEETKLFSLFS